MQGLWWPDIRQLREEGPWLGGCCLLYCRPFDLTHSGCPAWLLPVGQPERRWLNSRTMAQPFTAGKSFFKDLQEAPVGPGSWHLIWGVSSSWCQSKTLQTTPTAGRLWNCLFAHCPVHTLDKRPGGELLAKFSVCRVSHLGFSSPHSFFTRFSEGLTVVLFIRQIPVGKKVSISHSRYSGKLENSLQRVPFGQCWCAIYLGPQEWHTVT